MHAVPKQRTATERHKRLRHSRRQPHALPGGRHERRDPGRERRQRSRQAPTAQLGGSSEDLVEQHLGVVFVGAFGERELADQNLAGLGEHALLAGRQAAITLTTPEIPDHFCHLVDIARGELLQVGLVPPRPVRRLLCVRSTQHLENPIETLLTDHLPDAVWLSRGAQRSRQTRPVTERVTPRKARSGA